MSQSRINMSRGDSHVSRGDSYVGGDDQPEHANVHEYSRGTSAFSESEKESIPLDPRDVNAQNIRIENQEQSSNILTDVDPDENDYGIEMDEINGHNSQDEDGTNVDPKSSNEKTNTRKGRLGGITSMFNKSKKTYNPSRANAEPGQSKFSQFKNMFPGGKKGDQSVVRHMNTDEAYPSDLPRSDPYQATRKGALTSKVDSVKQFIFHPPERQMTGWVQQGPDIAPLNPVEGKDRIRSSNVLWLLLISGLIAGIIMTALSSKGEAMEVLGPTFIALSLLAIVGKLYFSYVWESEPFPRLTPYLNRLEEKLLQKKQKTPEKMMPWDDRARLNYQPNHEMLDETYRYPDVPGPDPYQSGQSYSDEPSSRPSSSLPTGATAADIGVNIRSGNGQYEGYHDEADDTPRMPDMDDSLYNRNPDNQTATTNMASPPTPSDPMYDNYPELFASDRQEGNVQESTSDEENVLYDNPSRPREILQKLQYQPSQTSSSQYPTDL